MIPFILNKSKWKQQVTNKTHEKKYEELKIYIKQNEEKKNANEKLTETKPIVNLSTYGSRGMDVI